MKKINFILGVVVLIVVSILLWGLMTLKSSTPVVPDKTEDIDRSKTIIIGATSETEANVKNDKYMYGVLAKYLSEKLASRGITDWKVIDLVSISGMAQLMRQGRVDLNIDSPFPTYIVNQLSGAEPIAIRWKDGYEKYNTALYANTSSGIKTLDDLKGKMIIFEDPYSTSGYFLPKTELLKRKYKLVEKKVRESVAPDEIGYYFSKNGHSEVDRGRASAAVEIGYKFDKISALRPSTYTLLLRTIDIYRHVVVIRSDLDPELKKAITSILLDMDKDPDAKKVLETISNTARFTALPDMNAAFNGVRELTNYLEQEIVAR